MSELIDVPLSPPFHLLVGLPWTTLATGATSMPATDSFMCPDLISSVASTGGGDQLTCYPALPQPLLLGIAKV